MNTNCSIAVLLIPHFVVGCLARCARLRRAGPRRSRGPYEGIPRRSLFLVPCSLFLPYGAFPLDLDERVGVGARLLVQDQGVAADGGLGTLGSRVHLEVAAIAGAAAALADG